MNKQKIYVVCWLENDKAKTKAYKIRKSAEKFGLKMMLKHDTAVNLATYRNGEIVNTAYLLNYGYAVKKDVWFKNYENFGFRKGGHFVEEGIADFNTMNKLGIRIAIKSNGYKV